MVGWQPPYGTPCHVCQASEQQVTGDPGPNVRVVTRAPTPNTLVPVMPGCVGFKPPFGEEEAEGAWSNAVTAMRMPSWCRTANSKHNVPTCMRCCKGWPDKLMKLHTFEMMASYTQAQCQWAALPLLQVLQQEQTVRAQPHAVARLPAGHTR